MRNPGRATGLAAARDLERESLHGFNTNRVAGVAGEPLYQYFSNKAALFERAKGLRRRARD
jgi:AcrR family transcriptional regulator